MDAKKREQRWRSCDRDASTQMVKSKDYVSICSPSTSLSSSIRSKLFACFSYCKIYGLPKLAHGTLVLRLVQVNNTWLPVQIELDSRRCSNTVRPTRSIRLKPKLDESILVYQYIKCGRASFSISSHRTLPDAYHCRVHAIVYTCGRVSFSISSHRGLAGAYHCRVPAIARAVVHYQWIA